MAAGLFESRGWTSLHEVAAHPRKLRRLEEELKNGVNVNQRSLCGETPLCLACRYKSDKARKPAVDLLLQYGADANLSDKQGRTPLMHAAMKGNLHVVATLLNSGHADPDFRDIFGQNAMLLAALEGHWEMVECLLQAGASEVTQNEDLVTPVSLAAEHGQSGCLEKLLKVAVEKGQKEVIDLRNGCCFTPIMDAARNGHVKCLQLLLKFGADPNLKIDNWFETGGSVTALHFAICGDNAECLYGLTI